MALGLAGGAAGRRGLASLQALLQQLVAAPAAGACGCSSCAQRRRGFAAAAPPSAVGSAASSSGGDDAPPLAPLGAPLGERLRVHASVGPSSSSSSPPSSPQRRAMGTFAREAFHQQQQPRLVPGPFGGPSAELGLPPGVRERERQAMLQETELRRAAEDARARREQLDAALARAPAPARPALETLARLTGMAPLQLKKLADAAARNAKQLTALRAPWVGPDEVRRLAMALGSGGGGGGGDCGGSGSGAVAADGGGGGGGTPLVLELLVKCPGLLRAYAGSSPAAALEVLRRYAYGSGHAGGDCESSSSGTAESSDAGDSSSAGESSSSASSSASSSSRSGGGAASRSRSRAASGGGGGGGARPRPGSADEPPEAALARLLRRAPHVLRAPPGTLEANLAFLTGRLQLSRAEARRAVGRHPQLLTAPPGAVALNMGLFVGMGASAADLRAMLVQSPGWATMPLRDLTIQWQFIRQELKGSLEDLVLTPELLQVSLLDTLGPRAGLARKKRVRLLMPSFSAAGHPALAPPREWARHRVAPLKFWMTAPPAQLCKVMGLDAGELARYQEAWRMTTGDRWRRLVLSPTAAGGGAGGGGGGGGDAHLVMLPHAKEDDMRGFRTAA